mmetsp:Transcript_8498/g.10589  ORF Transcript_8498/g.10589 Transcript_8498/m.10589 type:complete len:590 (+) Transcript_8498:33-1802(+)
MTNTYLPIHLDVQKSITKNQGSLNDILPKNEVANRRRSNSQSQVISTPTALSRSKEKPNKRNHVLYFVTLTPLNDTFIKKQLLVPYFPETRKLGRPAGSKVKPDITNGFFDSRVLSRSHAAMFIDSSSGKLMLKDLGSSNGTYVNEERIGNEPVEIKIGDIIYLGFNIQADTNHKQISAKVENINVMQNFYSSSSTIPSSFNFKNQLTMDTPEFKHYNFIQDIISKIPKQKTTKTDGLHLSFENALFGDINPNIEDKLLGLNSSGNCGIFNNAQITNASSLDSAIRVLTTNLSKIKQQNHTLATLEEFIMDYQARLNELNSNFLKQEYENKLKKLEDQISEEQAQTQETKDKHKSYKVEAAQLVEQLRKEITALTNEKHVLNQKFNEIDKSHEKDSNDGTKNLVESKESNTEKYASIPDHIKSNDKFASDSSKSMPTNDDKKQEIISSFVDDTSQNQTTHASNYSSSNIKDEDCSIIDSSNQKKSEIEPKETPSSLKKEIEPSRNTSKTSNNPSNLESDRSISSLYQGMDHKMGSYSAMLQLLPLKDKITIALYFTLLALIIQSIERNQGIIFGLSVVLFVNVFQRLSS